MYISKDHFPQIQHMYLHNSGTYRTILIHIAVSLVFVDLIWIHLLLLWEVIFMDITCSMCLLNVQV